MDSSTELQKPNKESQKYKEGQKIEFCQWYGTSYEVYKWDEKNDDRKLIAIKKIRFKEEIEKIEKEGLTAEPADTYFSLYPEDVADDCNSWAMAYSVSGKLTKGGAQKLNENDRILLQERRDFDDLEIGNEIMIL